jgi:hypothetical protein
LIYKHREFIDLTTRDTVDGKMDSKKNCGCTAAARDPLCSDSHKLMQMESEMKVKPRMFMPVSVNSGSDDTSSEDEYNHTPIPLKSSVSRTRYSANGRMIEDDGLQKDNRKILRKFETLNIQGQNLTGLSIGGFEVDLNVAAQKAMEILPMPASKLPVIFVDEELNFLHHFFQAVTKVLGENVMESIARKRTYYDDEQPIVSRMVEDLILEGYDKFDQEIVLFLKKVLCSTFELTSRSRRNQGKEGVRVCSNLWGFQYIECGMMMEEHDLQMWLSISYDQYRTSWFNTFKSSGVPNFSREGSGKTRSYSSFSSGSNSDRMLEIVREDDNESMVSRRSRSSKTTHRKQRNTAKQSSSKPSNMMTRYLAGQ